YPDSVPDFMQQHTIFILYYTNDGQGHSAQAGDIYTHWGVWIEFSSRKTPAQVLAIMTSIILWKGPPNSTSRLVVFQYMWALILASLVLAILLGSISCCGYVIYRNESMAPQPVKYSSLKTEEDEDLEL
ncbi:hypothetical protein B484DRAFT_404784, partial [Ochromonadaceae sp. CCMP2298]